MKSKALTGAFEVNHHLDHADHLLKGKIHGPECMITDGTTIYATLHDGNVVKINGEHVTHLAKFGKPCEFPIEEPICGRPLGIAFDTINPDNLIVVDAYYGLWDLNSKTGAKKQLLSPDQDFGVKVNFFNIIFKNFIIICSSLESTTSGCNEWSGSDKER